MLADHGLTRQRRADPDLLAAEEQVVKDQITEFHEKKCEITERSAPYTKLGVVGPAEAVEAARLKVRRRASV